MKSTERKLRIEQLDRKIAKLEAVQGLQVPAKGWINAIRMSLNMSLAQLARRLKKNPVTIQGMENREANHSITLKKLIEVGEALDLQFVYGFIPKESSLAKMIEKRAEEVAREIVMRTSHSMALEDQENSQERLQKAVKERAQSLVQEVPRHLWD
ncbi:MAG: mobile mystery protein A [Ignavibacteriales bacterium]|nr:mobile mystery protein A [Ignavibacteriales bacterium]